MSNGRSFTRNRKGSPGKSRRKAATRQRAQWAADARIKEAMASTIATATASLARMPNPALAKLVQEKVEEVRDSSADRDRAVHDAAVDLATVTAYSLEQAEQALQDVLNASERPVIMEHHEPK